MKRRSLGVAAVAAVLCTSGAAAQLRPPSTGGVVTLDRLLQRLADDRRVLVIAAHPDDEDTQLLALASLGYGADAAYLSLSRGEGGQNLIGEQLGVSLGLIRSHELLAARRVDGASQFFARGYDFGYSRSLDETARFWSPDTLLKDVVRVVRRWRPHVIETVWSGTPRDRHGQHTMAGVLAQRAFAIAHDSTSYPELAEEEGLEPWRPLKLYRSTFFDSAATTLHVETGLLEPRTGYSIFQIAMASRSRHRSQDFGVLQPIGPATARLALLESRVASTPDTALFAGIPRDTSWIARFADSLRLTLAPAALHRAVEPLASGLQRARRLGLPAHRLELLERALAVAAGLVVDVRASQAEVVGGETFDVIVEAYNGGGHPADVGAITLTTPTGWEVRARDDAASPLAPGTSRARRFAVTVSADAPPTQPYFLARPLDGALYDWSGVAPALRGLPFDPPLVRGIVTVVVAGTGITLSREAAYRFADQATGEVRRPVRVVPAIDVRLSPDLVVWPAGDRDARMFTVTLTNNARDTVVGRVELAGSEQAFRLTERGESRDVRFAVAPPHAAGGGHIELTALARTSNARVFRHGMELVDYPHIDPVARVRAATATITGVPIALPPLRRVGYVRGASDRVPEVLEQVGLPLEILTADMRARGDLGNYDAIVIGSRAYETDSALVRYNGRLLEYVRRGGRLLVQYQQYQYVRGGYAPYRFTIGFPHDRITDEAAPVRLLAPRHSAFHSPNVIGARDWDGWPQERGLYFADEWDDAYTPLLEMQDPGMDPVRGAVLVAPYGRGTYVYTGISFFRAIPAGAAGAVRFFLNLLAIDAAAND